MSAMKTYRIHFTELFRHIANNSVGNISQKNIDTLNVPNIESSKPFIDLKHFKDVIHMTYILIIEISSKEQLYFIDHTNFYESIIL